MLPEWVSPWWQATCLPERWDVAGVIVPSLTIWHTWALENIGNRYLCGGVPDRDDAASLLLFAARDMSAGRKLIYSDPYRLRAMRRIFRQVGGLAWSDLHAACSEYVDTCTRTPRRWQKEGAPDKGCSVPYQLHLVRALCADYHRTLEAAWNTPYALARMLYDAHAEAAGDTSIMKPQHEALDDEIVAERETAARSN